MESFQNNVAEDKFTPVERRQQLLRMKIRRSANMFNSDGDIICSPRSKAIKSDYADKFQKESAEWTSYLSNVTADQQNYAERIVNTPKTVDISILNNEQKLFLDDAVDTKEWIEHSNRFRRHVEAYVHKMEQYATATEAFEHVMDHQLDREAHDVFIKKSTFSDIRK